MAITTKVLIASKTAEATQQTQYTATGVTTIIDKFTAVNYSGAAATISVNLVTVSYLPTNSNLVVSSRTLQPGETYRFPELTGHVLNPGDYISTIAGTASAINIRASGREIA